MAETGLLGGGNEGARGGLREFSAVQPLLRLCSSTILRDGRRWKSRSQSAEPVPRLPGGKRETKERGRDVSVREMRKRETDRQRDKKEKNHKYVRCEENWRCESQTGPFAALRAREIEKRTVRHGTDLNCLFRNCSYFL